MYQDPTQAIIKWIDAIDKNTRAQEMAIRTIVDSLESLDKRMSDGYNSLTERIINLEKTVSDPIMKFIEPTEVGNGSQPGEDDNG